MKRTILIVGLVVVAVAVFGVGVAFAQGITPYVGHGPMIQNGEGYLHTYMVTALAEKLGLKVEDVNARITAGKTIYDIAIADSVKAKDFPARIIEVHAQAVSTAMKDDIITQKQTD